MHLPTRLQAAIPCLLLLVTFTSIPANACTTMVACGRATTDGRPLLWKNRDAPHADNEVVFFNNKDGHDFVAVTNAGAQASVWMGMNDAGFCIENSLSRDIKGDAKQGLGNGRFMKQALTTCATIADFKRLLEETNATGRKTRSNFGVIDAHGGAAIFETGPTSFTRFDTASQAATPEGYIVRTNFSITASGRKPLAEIYSSGRYQRAGRLIEQATQKHKLDARFVIRNLARDVGRQASWPTEVPANNLTFPQFINTTSTINRRTTVSAVVFQGVRPGEDPSLTTMWVLLGQPMFSVAVPCWVKAGKVAAELDGTRRSPLCSASLQLRNLNYDAGRRNMATTAIPVILNKTLETEDHIYEETSQQLELWRKQPPTAMQMAEFHRRLSTRALKSLEELTNDQTVLATAKLISESQSTKDSDSIHADFRFDDDDKTRLADTTNYAGKAAWDGGLTDSNVVAGNFRIRRNSTKPVNRYVDIDPNVRIGGSSGEQRGTPRGWIVMEASGWNLRGKTPNELIRFGFTSQAEKNIQTAGFVIARTSADKVVLSGRAFGEGSSLIESNITLPVHQQQPVTFVIELDKQTDNNGEGNSGGKYKLYYRVGTKAPFKPVGKAGNVRRLRNGNQLHLHIEGFFGAREEFFDIDRIYYTNSNPITD